MKRTLTINISGTVFHIDEDAYDKLQAYLLDINRYFGSDPEGREIIMDIEARIAELFQEKTKSDGNVVTIQHVEEVIEVMGRPSDFAVEEEEEEPTEHKKRTFRTGKRLYRDPEHQVIGGVCGGLGAYFNLDPVIFRLAFVLLFLVSHGIILLLYLIFWIVVPKAITTSQRLEMRGEDVNIDNIKKTIKDEFQDVKKNYQKFRNSPSYERGRDKINEAGSVLGSVLRVILKVIVIIIGVALIIGGLLTIIGLVGSLFISNTFLGIVPWGSHVVPNFFHFYVGTDTLNWLMISVAALVGIPLLALIYLGTKLVFRYKSNNAAVGLSAFALWINETEMSLIYKIGIMIALLLTSLVSNGQSKSYRIYSEFDQQDGFSWFSVSKSMLDVVDLTLNDENKKVSGDLKEIRIMVFNPKKTQLHKDFYRMMNHKLSRMRYKKAEPENSDPSDNVSFWIKGNKRKVRECHIVIGNDNPNGLNCLISFYGDMDVRNLDELKSIGESQIEL